MASKQKFNIGDEVFHILPDSPQGVILDVSYSFRYDEYKYHVVWSLDKDMWYIGDELSLNQAF